MSNSTLINNTPGGEKQVNLDVLNELLSEIGEGGEEMISNIITTYLSYTPTLFTAMDKAFIENDIKTIYRSAHTLKSSSANLGAINLSEVSKQLEIKLKPLAEAPLSPEELTQIKTHIQQQSELLKEFFQKVSRELLDYQNKLLNP